MYRLKSKSKNQIQGFTSFDINQDFPTKAEAKAAAENDWGKKIQWKIKSRKKKKVWSGDLGGVAYYIQKIKSEKTEKEIPQTNEPRSARDFVEDMISDGRTPKEIMAVAQSCRWKHHLPTIKDVLEEFSKKLKI